MLLRINFCKKKYGNGTFFRNVPKGISSYLILMEGIIFWDVDSAFANSKIIPGWNPQLLPVTKNLHGDNIRKILVKKMRMFLSTSCHVMPCFIFHLSQTVVITSCNNFCFAFFFKSNLQSWCNCLDFNTQITKKYSTANMLIFHPTFSHGRVVEEGRQTTNVTVFTVEQLAAREIRVRMCFFIAFF